jgi:GalNAc-alpha-(1->4)-GalNAc-alpha-(1->3)-diNAcBac-PP-undecaprenol alpha-1,4-N-acetyl-D-galactosaminyltransferase
MDAELSRPPRSVETIISGTVRPVNLLFFIPRVKVGGAERVLSILANALVRQGYMVGIATMGSSNDFYELDPRIRRIRLGLNGKFIRLLGGISANFFRLLAIRRTVLEVRPDVVISFLDRTNIRVLLATIGLEQPIIVTEHSHPGTHSVGLLWAFLRRLLYRRARYLVAVGQGVYDWFSWMPTGKRVIIYNPLPLIGMELEKPQIRLPADRQRLVSAGRFVPSKAFDVLIHTFARLAMDYPTWDLVIVGDGPLREKLRALAVSLGLSSRCQFPGIVGNLHGVLRQCDLFCLTSTTEGLGMVILEAMQAGLPVVSTDCPTGPREIIQHEQNGILVPVGDHEALVRALRGLMGNPRKRSRLGAGTGPVLARHSMDNIIEKWKHLLASC